VRPAGALAQRPRDVVVFAKCGQHHDGGIRGRAPDLGRGGQPVELRHPDVEEGHVGPVAACLLDRLAAVRGLGHDLDARIGGQDRLDTGSDHGLIVGEQEADHEADGTS
jgi:hypothetical protein